MCEDVNGSSGFREGFAGANDRSASSWWRIDANPSSKCRFQSSDEVEDQCFQAIVLQRRSYMDDRRHNCMINLTTRDLFICQEAIQNQLSVEQMARNREDLGPGGRSTVCQEYAKMLP
jgi:hypothetical protein